MAARTLSNTMEMMLTVVALNYWPLSGIVHLGDTKNWLRSYQISLIFASIACIIRPTNALIWIYLGSQLLISSGSKRFIVALNATFVW